MNWLKRVLGKEWNINPAGGLTGEAFFAEKDDHRLFLKRNSSPFLAVLSAEGIVPKLIWTKRMENGDVITAQKWLNGRALKAEEMQHHQVAGLIGKIHHSSELLHMLMRLGKKPITSDERLAEITKRLRVNGLMDKYKEVRDATDYLHRLLPVTRGQQKVVCHCDLNHNNILLTDMGKLYLVDWDNAMIADPAMDFGFILKWYVPQEDWEEWLHSYGVDMDESLIERMYWYLIMDALYYLIWHNDRDEVNKSYSRLQDLQQLNMDVNSVILN
ncbi:phosphotransferase family protein [Virgibacillus doumboii]|uniref:phosphotransferase family protein n=1 Tax=Virgibacillus doumboii TaxID=2697503 RepID=UPI0013E0890B|nr:phosphotransferase family protein [Virgibacillus doumboii]